MALVGICSREELQVKRLSCFFFYDFVLFYDCLLFNVNMIFSGYNTFLLAVEQVKQNAKVRTSAGQFRLLIRICLVRRCLHMPVEILVRRYARCI